MKSFRFIMTVIVITTLASCQASVTSESSDTMSGRFDKIAGYSIFDEPTGFKALESEIGSADFEFHLDSNNRLTVPGDGSISPRMLLGPSPDDDVFDGFVVVQLHKLAQIEGVETRVSQVNDYFFSRSASRVLVTGLSGSGKSIYSDKTTKPNKTVEVR